MKNEKIGFFKRISILLLIAAVPMFVVNFVAYQSSSSLMKSYMIRENTIRLEQIATQVNRYFQQLENFATHLLADNDVKTFEYATIDSATYTPARIREAQIRTLQKMNMIIAVMGGDMTYALYTPSFDYILTTPGGEKYTSGYFRSQFNNSWQLQKHTDEDGITAVTFRKQFSQKAYSQRDIYSNNIVEVSCSPLWLRSLLSSYNDSGSDIAYISSNGMMLSNFDANTSDFSSFVDLLNYDKTSEGHTIIPREGKNVLFSHIPCDALGGHFVAVVPLTNILRPLSIVQTTYLITILFMLLFMSAIFFLLYRRVKAPVNKLVDAMDGIKKGDYKTRIHSADRDEFNYLMTGFNEMAEKTDQLINHVYMEKLRAQEAVFKQYQAQINPHFLYNCLFFIKNMASIGENDAVVKFSLHMASYYRYTTRVDEYTTSLKDEIDFITHYLNIMKLRFSRMDFSVDIPAVMMDAVIPKLMLQPFIENAIVHGVEKRADASQISVIGAVEEDFYRITIENDGPCLSDKEISQIREKVFGPEPAQTSYGLWNINQRIQLFFKGDAAIDLEQKPNGGLRATVRFAPGANAEQIIN